jgi:hypothetical protein
MRAWVFAFQKSVALAYSRVKRNGQMHLLISHDDYNRSVGPRGLSRRSEDWTSEEYAGQGHGWQSNIIRAKHEMAHHEAAIIATTKLRYAPQVFSQSRPSLTPS